MKIDINEVRLVPKTVSKDFKLCVYGNLSHNIKEWVDYHKLSLNQSHNYTNIIIPENTTLSDLFLSKQPYQYIDGFSPNLNKELHIGHLSNLILAKSYVKLGCSNKIVSIYGDIGTKEVNDEGLSKIRQYQLMFDYRPDIEYLSSNMIDYRYLVDNLLTDGLDDYEGCKVFELSDKLVGIKSNGTTTYFFQDVVLATILNDKTLYLTGNEQINHFNHLRELFPNQIEHIGLGLVSINGSKMSSRLSNVVLIKDLLKLGEEVFENYSNELIYNVFAGFILKSSINTNKSISVDDLTNPNKSLGLYISYTTARLISAGCNIVETNCFKSKHLEYAYLMSKFNLKPNILFIELYEHCKVINKLYLTHYIKDNEPNRLMFNQLLSDLVLGLNKLGMYVITKI